MWAFTVKKSQYFKKQMAFVPIKCQTSLLPSIEFLTDNYVFFGRNRFATEISNKDTVQSPLSSQKELS